MVPASDAHQTIVVDQPGQRDQIDDVLDEAPEPSVESVQLKSELMAQMGHEIRTPLTGVLGTTELLLNTDLSDEQREYANATMTSATTLMVVLNDILDYSMLEAGTLELDAGTFEVRSMVESLGITVSKLASDKGLAVVSSSEESVPHAVCGDGKRIRHVLTKLVLSALKNTTHGQVTVRLSVAEPRGKFVLLRFEVSDTGPGMTDASLESIFDPYSQSSSATMQNDRAVSLGLTVCKQLIDLMGGAIGVKSTVGEGTTVWFTTPVGIDGATPYPEERMRVQHTAARVPAATIDPQRASAPARAPLPAGTARVLIADDDPVSQLVITRQLQMRGFIVDVARNGLEAIEKHANEAYSAIFMDCQMPELNGYDATSAIREREGADVHTPIIAMTASVRESDRELCFVSGMDDYVAKPLDQMALDAAIARRIPSLELDGPGADSTNGAEADTARPAGDPRVPLLDGSVLTDVFRHNSESRSYLIGVFVDESHTRINQLSAATEESDTKTMLRLTHALKGSAGAVGARRLEVICSEAHDAVLVGHVSDAARLLGRIERCFDMTSQLLFRGCPQARDAASARH
jgi:CheY-like chemotaxis protein/HPt (histidine-containing phosphotransfer) domain-containing protein